MVTKNYNDLVNPEFQDLNGVGKLKIIGMPVQEAIKLLMFERIIQNLERLK